MFSFVKNYNKKCMHSFDNNKIMGIIYYNFVINLLITCAMLSKSAENM